MDYIKLLLMLISGLAWTLVYIESIRIGFRDKTYCIPFWALALNFVWEVWHGVFDLYALGPQLQVVINGIWALFDVAILITFFRYGKRYFPAAFSRAWFYAWGIGSLLMAFGIQYAFAREFGTIKGGGYAAFLQNLLMSVLFIAMLYSRKGTEGQSMTIAISKCLGTLAPTMLFGIVGSVTMGGPNSFMLIIGIFVFMVDVVYIFLLRQFRLKEIS